MRTRNATIAAIAALGAAALAAPATAAADDTAATHAYLAADYAVLHASVNGWSRVEANIDKLEAQLGSECPQVGAGSPQNEEAQKLSLEVAGALWSAGYSANAGVVHSFVAKVAHLRWSNPAVTKAARKLAQGLTEMTALPSPPLCADVRAWAADGYGSAPADVDTYDRHVEAIEVHRIPRRLLAPYIGGADRALAAADERLNTRLEELEFVHGQDQWNKLLEVLALNQ